MSRTSCNLVAALLILSSNIFSSQAKPIRLKNETIDTTPAANATAQAKTRLSAATSGLCLIQFTGPVDAAEREELQTLGVKLLRYVPEDAFIAKLANVSPAQVGALSFVTWVGPYRPEHKIHPRLASAAQSALQTNGVVPVAILLSPEATPAEVAEVRALLAAVPQESHLRQGTIVRGLLPPARLNALAQHNAVLWLEHAPKRRLVDEVASKLVGGDDGQLGTRTVTQQEGFDGSGVVVAVADTGLDSGDTNAMHPDIAGRVAGLIFYGSLTDASDEHSHGTHVAGIIAGNAATGEVDDSGALYGLGVAPGASLVAQRIFDADGAEVNPPFSDEGLTHDAVRAGAKIGSNSWGTDVQGAYDIDCAAFDELVRDADAETPGDQPYILEFSAGNAGPGPQTMDSPGCAKNVIATGASENGGQLDFGLYDDGADTMADFSSRGPCEDGRLKPDVVAPGTFIASMLSSAASSDFAWLPIDNYYIYMGGTSQAGPHASGAAAVFVQYYKSLHTNAVPSPALVKAALINSAQELDEANGGPGPIPNSDEGWGRINLPNIIIANPTNSIRVCEFIDQTTLLTNSQVYTHHVFVQNSNEPLRITMAYTDVAGFPGAIPALVNDLDLEVVGPDGTMYRGNQFIGGESTPNAPSADNLNNVEGVILAAPRPGDYLVRVRARKIVLDARLDTQAIDQDFALVSSGNLARSGAGVVLLDRTEYSAPGMMQLTVFDANRTATNSVSAGVTNLTHPNGLKLVLPVTSVAGMFTGSVVTVVGTAPVSGKLAVSSGDALQASYLDFAGTLRIATATAVLAPPVLTGVVENVDLGLVTISWVTDQLSDSTVRYGTNANLAFSQTVTDATLTTNHVVRLSNLIAGRTYYYAVSSADAAGNAGTNSNAAYHFVAVVSPTVLLVDAWEQDAGGASPAIPDSVYTNALAGSGFSFAVWKVTDRGGGPALADLRPFQCVIWWLTDDAINYPGNGGTNDTLSAAQQTMILNYLNGGGSFLMSSMGILNNINEGPFRRNVLHVDKFIVNSDPLGLQCPDCDQDFGVPSIQGALNDPITGGISMPLDYTNYPYLDVLGDGSYILGPDLSDTFTPTTNAAAIVFEPASGKVCGARYPATVQTAPGRTVFLSFPVDTTMDGSVPPNSETNLLRNILNFLVPSVNGAGSVLLDDTAYKIPSLVTVQVADGDLSGTGHAQVAVRTSSSGGPVTLTLNETPQPGVFLGFITLVATNAPGTNQIHAQNGDAITVTYFDASAGTNVTATAIVDTVPPVITGTALAPKYFDAVATWRSSKPADSLVQFGESKLLGRTAYVAPLTTNHSVSVAGLVPNRMYYYQVVCTDDAGNATVDDDHGSLYSFQTLKAITPPWSDNLETGATNWTVIPGASSQVNWTLGVPQNGLASSAHSGTNAWGSDLSAQAVDYAESFLYSPSIDLTAAGQATLTFWDDYDFTSPDLIEMGELMVATNFVDTPVAIAEFTNVATLGWTQEMVDLSAYAGSPIMVVWHYVGSSRVDLQACKLEYSIVSPK